MNKARKTSITLGKSQKRLKSHTIARKKSPQDLDNFGRSIKTAKSESPKLSKQSPQLSNEEQRREKLLKKGWEV